MDKLVKEAFDGFEKNGGTGCIDLLKELDVFPIMSIVRTNYNLHSDYQFHHSYEGMIKTILLKELDGKPFVEILKKVEDKEEAKKLGFNPRVPSKRTFYDFKKRRVNGSANCVMEGLIFKIRNEAKRRGLSLFSQKKKRDVDSMTEWLCWRISEDILSKISIPMKYNSKYKREDVLDVLLHTALTGDFLENGVKTFREEYARFTCNCEVCANISLDGLKKLYNAGKEKLYYAEILFFKHNISQQEFILKMIRESSEKELDNFIDSIPEGAYKSYLRRFSSKSLEGILDI